jgi:hypothetical protein
VENRLAEDGTVHLDCDRSYRCDTNSQVGGAVAGDARLSDVDPDLDREVSLASRIKIRIMHELMERHQSMFPGKMEPVCDGIHDEDSPR